MNVITGKMPTQRKNEYKGFIWRDPNGVIKWSLHMEQIPDPKKFSEEYIKKYD